MSGLKRLRTRRMKPKRPERQRKARPRARAFPRRPRRQSAGEWTVWGQRGINQNMRSPAIAGPGPDDAGPVRRDTIPNRPFHSR